MNPAAQTFKTLGEPTRLQLLQLLQNAGKPLCVCELVDSLNTPQYNVSKHLKELEREGFIVSAKEGKWVYYSVAEHLDDLKKSIIKMVAELNGAENSAIQNRLNKRLQIRVNGKCTLGIQNRKLITGEGKK